jgi:hypothetical protein
MSYTERFSEANVLLTVLTPVSRDAAATSSYVSLANYQRAFVVLHCGALTGTQDMQLKQATDTSGTSAKVITGKAITQLAASDDDDVVAIEVRTEELDVDGGFDCIAALTTPSAANIYAVQIWGCEARFKPVPTTAFAEIID